MKDTKLLHQIVDDYIHSLREISPDSETLEQQAATLTDKFKHDLLEAGPEPFQLELYSRYSFVCFKADKQVAEPDDYDDISLILRHHLRVEYALRRYIKTWPTTKKIGLEESATFSYYLGILKDKSGNSDSEYRRTFYSALSEIEVVRNRFSHNLKYQLKHDDVEQMRQFIELHLQHAPDSAGRPADTYTIFCNYCYDHFAAGVWGINELNRKIEKLPEPQPDWTEFVRRYSFQRDKETGSS